LQTDLFKNKVIKLTNIVETGLYCVIVAFGTITENAKTRGDLGKKIFVTHLNFCRQSTMFYGILNCQKYFYTSVRIPFEGSRPPPKKKTEFGITQKLYKIQTRKWCQNLQK